MLAVVRISTDNLVYTMIMHLLFNTINVLLSYMKLTEIPVAVVFAVFVATIILFIALVMMFFRKSVIEMRGSRFEGKYKPWKAITKEGYVTIAMCVIVMGILLMI